MKRARRHHARELAVQFLFQRDFNPDELEPALEAFWDQQQVHEESRPFCEEIIRGVEEHRDDIDDQLAQYAINWSLDRMGGVDRNVMRVALFEMLFREDIPPVVSIDEAVNIAKDFGSDESGRFVNGILDRAVKELDRPLRSVSKSDPKEAH